MRLDRLLTARSTPASKREFTFDVLVSQAASDTEASGIFYDSRRVIPGGVFVARRGEKTNGHHFLKNAVEAGAVAVVGEDSTALSQCGAPVVCVTSDAHQALAELACAFNDHPSRQMDVIGVTGTNGKTTTVHLIERLFAGLGLKTGRIGTLGVKIGDEEIEGAHTTPEAPELQATLRRMADAGVQKVAMEVSSHALAQDRTWGTRFSTVVFTNLTQDHLDYHADMEDYFQAKLRLFRDYPPEDGRMVVNLDDPFGRRLVDESLRPTITYGLSEAAHLRAENVQMLPSGSEFTLNFRPQNLKIPVRLRLPGLFNVYNALAALAAVYHQSSKPMELLLPILESLTGAPGRFETVDAGQDFAVLVDYAHTPDALENVLRAARKITSSRVLAVFGCGGDRDRTKRPKMGRIAASEADVAYVTSDNPRTEDAEAIVKDILTGMEGSTNVTVEVDRRSAIYMAIQAARTGDTVVIAGKGHEDYQILGTTKHHFDDREVAREALEVRRSSH